MQPYIRSTIKNRTRKKKSAVEEDPRKSPEKIKKNEPLEKMKSTESLKKVRPQNKSEKRTKYIKTALQMAKNGTEQPLQKKPSISKQPCKLLRTEPLKTGRPENKPELKKLTSVRIL